MKEIITSKVTDIFSLYRGMILDSVEAEYDRSANWKYLRTRLLKLLGDRGLEGKIQSIIMEAGHE